MTKNFTFQQYLDAREKVKAAFKELKKQGLVTHMNFMCCGGCASSQIACDFGKKTEQQQAKIKGAVYYNRQTERGFEKGGCLMLNYGEIEFINYDTKASVKTLIPTVEVGNMVKAELEKQGLFTNWNGDQNECIEVMVALPRNLQVEVALP